MKSSEITRRAVEKELVSHKSGVLLLLSSSQPRDARYLSAVTNFEKIAHDLMHLADAVILDLGPGITPINERVIALCNQVFVVIEPQPGTVALGRSLIEDLISAGLGEGKIDTVLVNRTRSSAQLTLNQVQGHLGHQVSTVFKPDPELAYQACMRNQPMMLLQPDGSTAQQFQKMAAKIVDSVAHRVDQLTN
jgi:Flp pilus assembly CpaE family ATPase